MTIAQQANQVVRLLKRNSPVIFSATAITGVVTTAYLASKATLQASKKLETYESLEDAVRPRRERIQQDVKLCWQFYIPTVASGAMTIACIIGTTRVTGKRAAAAQAAFLISERAFSEYRGKVIEEYGDRKDQTIRDSIASDRVKNNPPSSEIVIVGRDSLCCELHTGRYFSSDMESLRKAQNDLNERLINHDSATLDDFYYLIGLPSTSHSGDIGWNSDKMLKLEFTPVMTEQGQPCLAFEYNYTRPLFDGMFK